MPRQPVRGSSSAPGYLFDDRSGRYRDAATGRFVKQSAVLEVLGKQQAKSAAAIRGLTEQMQAGKLSLTGWRDGMVREIKAAHTAQYVAGQGGWAKMTPAHWGRLGSILKGQYRYLNGFAADLQKTALYKRDAAGKLIDGRIAVRAQLYALAANATYERSRRLQRQAAGMTAERRHLGKAEHCAGCVEAAAQGWQPIGTLSPIGTLECNIGCQCHFEYR